MSGRTPSEVIRAAAEPRESLAWLGWYRFVAIIGVVLIHVNGLTAVEHLGDGSAVGQWARGLDFLSRWSVPGFVMASGAMLLDPERFKGTAHFLRRRASRLVPPLIFWHMVYVAMLAYGRGFFDPVSTLPVTMIGKLYTALYFFWIVLGLALVTPLLVPWVASVSAREVGIAGVVLALMPAAAMAIVPEAPASEVWVRTAFTWWIPYLGYFLLGYAVRRATLSGGRAVGALVGFVGGSWWIVWQWGRASGVGGVLEHYQPAESYFHVAVIVSTCASVYLTRWVVRPGGIGAAFAAPRLSRVGRGLGSATLGVFGVHQVVLAVVERLPILGGGQVADSVPQLVARCVAVVVGSYAFALVAARIPGLRRVV